MANELLQYPTLLPLKELEDFTESTRGQDGRWIVILYNCDCHDFEEVIVQIQLATQCGQARAEQIAEEAHHTGRAIALSGSPGECERAAGILRSIGLQVETDIL